MAELSTVPEQNVTSPYGYVGKKLQTKTLCSPKVTYTLKTSQQPLQSSQKVSMPESSTAANRYSDIIL